MVKPIALRLSRLQADWLAAELEGIINDHTERGILEPEEELAARRVLADLEAGLSLAAARLDLEIRRLRSITTTT